MEIAGTGREAARTAARALAARFHRPDGGQLFGSGPDSFCKLGAQRPHIPTWPPIS